MCRLHVDSFMMTLWLSLLRLSSVYGLSASDRGDDVIRLHVGSCNDNEEGWAQPFWKVVAERQPDGFFWSGDIVYGDHDIEDDDTPATTMRLRKKYAAQKSHPGYAAAVLANSNLVVDGTWDDHDFGMDNADGFTFDATTKDAHKAEILDFLDAASNDERRLLGRGLYTSRVVGPRGEVDVVLLDTRYNRNEHELLGKAQWAWLNDHFAQSTAEVTVVVSSVQVLAEGRTSLHEGWWAYPQERQRLVETMVSHGIKAPLLVSGDVHFAELSAHTCSSSSSSATLAEMTSSGMTHAWAHGADGARHHWWPVHYTKHWLMLVSQHVLGATAWTYQYPGAFYLDLNLGEVDVDLAARTVVGRVLDVNGNSVLERTWAMDELDLSKLQAPPSNQGNYDGANTFSPSSTIHTHDDFNGNFSAYDQFLNAEPSVACVPQRGEASLFVRVVGYLFTVVVFLIPLLAFVLQLASLPKKFRRLQSWAAQTKAPIGHEIQKLQLCANAWAAATRAPGLKARRRFGSWVLKQGASGLKLKRIRSWESFKGPVLLKSKKLDSPSLKLRKLAGTREVLKLRGRLRRAIEKVSSSRSRISAGF